MQTKNEDTASAILRASQQLRALQSEYAALAAEECARERLRLSLFEALGRTDALLAFAFYSPVGVVDERLMALIVDDRELIELSI